MAATAAAPVQQVEREPQSEREVISMFEGKRSRLDAMWSKINELVAEVSEHELVIKALTDMDAGRKCFRLVGDVLVERTVGETLPAVQKHMDQVVTAVERLQQTSAAASKDMSEFEAKYKIKVRNGNEEEDDGRRGGGSQAPQPVPQGVLVSAI